MKKLLMLIAILSLTACTYSITQVHTEGQASDVVDETATNAPSTTASVPVSLMPSTPIPAKLIPAMPMLDGHIKKGN